MSTERAAVSAKYFGRLPLTLDADRSVGSAELAPRAQNSPQALHFLENHSPLVILRGFGTVPYLTGAHP